ncbi:hypothetical protein E2C01_026034 [Portunus trituberculatus]|uniref:Uncharacterized protein n=1 Tax=Portunus trituberculatus TaxID=210409 RepID=A0A5B7EH20_PORTR|nr:hypothetical protein [Portunus trituberculatus]
MASCNSITLQEQQYNELEKDAKVQLGTRKNVWYLNVRTRGCKQRLLASPSPAPTATSCSTMIVKTTTFSCVLSVVFHLETYNGTKEAY